MEFAASCSFRPRTPTMSVSPARVGNFCHTSGGILSDLDATVDAACSHHSATHGAVRFAVLPLVVASLLLDGHMEVAAQVRERMQVVFPAGYALRNARKVTLERLARYPHVSLTPDTSVRRVIDVVFGARGLPISSVCEVSYTMAAVGIPWRPSCLVALQIRERGDSRRWEVENHSRRTSAQAPGATASQSSEIPMACATSLPGYLTIARGYADLTRDQSS